MNVKQIVEGWLTANGYDGLFDFACGCKVGDLMPCDEYAHIGHCKPGVFVECPHPEDCECSNGDRSEFHIGPKEET